MHTTPRTFKWLSAAALLLGAWPAAPVLAQFRMDAEAVSGGRFGVGRLTVMVPRDMVPEPLGIEGLGLSDKNGRVLFPAIRKPVFGRLVKQLFAQGPPLMPGGPVPEEVGGLLRGILDRPPRTTIYFLFSGEDPLELTLEGRSVSTFTLAVRNDPDANKQLLQQWWNVYTASPRLLEKKPDYPLIVQNYLTTNLARRLILELPEQKQTESWQDQFAVELGLILGSESIRIAMQQDRILGLNNLGQAADQPLPEPVDPPPIEFPPGADAKIEPLAMRVPQECLYIRFGSFANLLWTQDTLATWGGDFQNLFSQRGLDYELSRRIEDRLVLGQTALSKLLGGTIIADVALIGTDLFFREGAAFGILFRARQSDLLGIELKRQRQERLDAGGVTETQLSIGRHKVSYLAAPDGSVRSYYVVDGDYHFVTTSRTLAKRFLETASTGRALGTSPDFRHARTVMPLSGNYAVFAYLSDAFFRNFTGPHYRVEMARRLQATADIDLVRLAVLAAASENKPGDSIEDLIAGELLPASFGKRPDGSATLLAGGEVYDSLRGHRGAFPPVPDVPVEKAARAELSAYRKFVDFYHENWGRLDPTSIGVRRHALPENRERIELDVQLSPFASEHFAMLSKWAGPPDKKRLVPIESDVAAAELVLQKQHVFAGLADFGSPLEMATGRLVPTAPLGNVLIGHIGTTGPVGVLNFLDVQIATPSDERGYAGTWLGLWRRQIGPFTVFSLHPELLSAVTPQLRFEESPRPAQLRLRIEDLSRAKITPFLNNLGYTRTRETSLGNLRLLHAANQQLRVPVEDCRTASEFLLGAKLVCPLQGRYVFKEAPRGLAYWTSTALAGSDNRRLLGTQAPEGYQSPPLNWFRGLKLDAMMTERALSARAELIVQLPASANPTE